MAAPYPPGGGNSKFNDYVLLILEIGSDMLRLSFFSLPQLKTAGANKYEEDFIKQQFLRKRKP